jgi:hypothetical protein
MQLDALLCWKFEEKKFFHKTYHNIKQCNFLYNLCMRKVKNLHKTHLALISLRKRMQKVGVLGDSAPSFEERTNEESVGTVWHRKPS